jgi:excisionase family DNA binding protein
MIRQGNAPSILADETARNTLSNESTIILPETPNILTVGEVAVILRLTPHRVRDLCRREVIPAIKLGQIWRVSRVRLERLLGGNAS